MTCTVVGSICLSVGTRRLYGFNLTDFCANYWEPAEVRAVGERVRPVLEADGGGGATGYEYEVTTAGQSGVTEPAWPTTIAETVTDGSVVWTCRQLSNASLSRTIADSTWTAPTGVAVDGESVVVSNGEQKVFAFITGTALVNKAIVTDTVEFSDGQTEDFALKVSVK